jgi:vacuolar-type H+-ATPase subunit E/Vma4
MSTLAKEELAQDRLLTDLEPVRAELFADARDEAARIVSAARRDADELRAETERRCDVEVAAATRHGDLVARAIAERTLARARNDARAKVLERQERARNALVASVHEAVLDLRHDPRYPDLLDVLEDMARHQLGPSARVDRDPISAGGVTATVGPRQVDYSLPALADRALDALGDEVIALWM